jgi:uncharacterized protein (DUF305 family)
MRAALVALPALLIAACGGQGETAPAEEPHHAAMEQNNPAQQAFADANQRMHAAMSEIPEDADEAFMRGMLAHHRGAVEMAEVELEYGRDEQARDLAQRILNAQSEEIAEMEAWLSAKGLESDPPAQTMPMDHSAH